MKHALSSHLLRKLALLPLVLCAFLSNANAQEDDYEEYGPYFIGYELPVVGFWYDVSADYFLWDWIDAEFAGLHGASANCAGTQSWTCMRICKEANIAVTVAGVVNHGLQYKVDLPTATGSAAAGLYMQAISFSITFNDMSHETLQISEIMRVVGGDIITSDGTNLHVNIIHDQNVMTDNVKKGFLHTPQKSFTVWIEATWIPGSSTVNPAWDYGSTGVTHVSSDNSTVATDIYTTGFYSKPGYDSTRLASGNQMINRGFTFPWAANLPVIDFITSSIPCP